LVACQHYCLYTYLIIPDYKYTFDNFYKNYYDYCKDKKKLEYHKNGLDENYTTTRELISSVFSHKN